MASKKNGLICSMYSSRIALLFFVILIFSCGEKKSNVLSISGECQGTTYRVVYYADQLDRKKDIDSILHRFDLDLSLWVENSLINRFNNFNRIDTVFDFYDSTKYLSVTYEIAREVFKQTDGAFDPTVYPLVNAWGFGLEKRQEVTQELVDSLLKLVSFNHQNCDLIELSENYVYTESWLSKGQPGVQIDFNGIAQGVAVDFIAEYLWQQGIDDFMVEIGGEVYCSGVNEKGQPWQIAIDKPLDNGERAIETVVGITNAGIATSGSYRRFYEKDGKKYSHTINPKTGYPVEHSLLSATVVAVSAGHADAYATALMVMGPNRAQLYLQNAPSDLKAAYMIYEENDKLKVWMTESMKSLLPKPQP